jgi:hypothetical protein
MRRVTNVVQWIEDKHGTLVVRIEAPAVIPDADPSEPCFEPPTMRTLEEAQRLADAGEIEALAKLGEVYMRRSA